MLYSTLKYWVKAGFGIFFRKIYFRGLEKVDPSKPAIFAVNHPSAFIEPTLIATSVPFQVHFLTRGDVFNPKFLWFFNATNQVPVFRFKDGFSQLKTNRDSFEKCYEKLLEGAKLLIFCEGSMKWIKRMRGVQPGAAKLAFGTLEIKKDLPLVIHPVGVNYDDHTKFRSDVMVEIGNAIPVENYWNLYQDDQRKAIKELTAEIKTGLAQCVLHIERDEDLEIGTLLWDIVKNDFLRNSVDRASSVSTPFKSIQPTLIQLNNNGNDSENSLLHYNLNEYLKCLKLVDFSDKEVSDLENRSTFARLAGATLNLLLLPFALLNSPPLLLAGLLSKKLTPNVEFYSSVRVVLFTLFYTFFLVLLFGFVYLIYLPWWIGLIIPAGGWLFLQFKGYLRAFWKLLTIDAEKRKKLIDLRRKILFIIAMGKKNYANPDSEVARDPFKIT